MGKKINLHKEEKQDLVVEGGVYKVGAMYTILAGDDIGQVGVLDSITWKEEAGGYWWLTLDGGHQFNANFAREYLEEIDHRDFLKCKHCGKWNDR